MARASTTTAAPGALGIGMGEAIAWWTLAWLVTLATYPFTNDHFGRISAARQIADSASSHSVTSSIRATF
jgi:hypothetical protein